MRANSPSWAGTSPVGAASGQGDPVGGEVEEEGQAVEERAVEVDRVRRG